MSIEPALGRSWAWAAHCWTAGPGGAVDHLFADCPTLARARMVDRFDGSVFVLGETVCRGCHHRWIQGVGA